MPNEGAEQFLEDYDKPLRIRDGLHKHQISQFAEAYAASRVQVLEERLAKRGKLHDAVVRYLAISDQWPKRVMIDHQPKHKAELEAATENLRAALTEDSNGIT